MKRKIGRIDTANFPVLELEAVEVKIDTGAYTSSIHCTAIKVEDDFLKCTFLDENQLQYHGKEFVFDQYDVRVVKSSNGQTQTRYRILTEIELFGKIHAIFLTLSDRAEMKYPVLLGRKFLTKRFMIDINATNLSHKMKLAKSNSSKTETTK